MKRLAPLGLIALSLLVAVLVALPSPYYILKPGGSYEVGPRLTIPAEYRQPTGQLAFTAVRAAPGSWVDVVNARFDPASEAVPAEEVRPSGVSQEQYIELSRRMIIESKKVAAAVGLRAAGYDARIIGQGAEVAATLKDFPADGVLQPGDAIVAADGQPVETATGLVEIIRRHQVGDQISLTIVRDGQRQDVAVGTKSSTEEPGRPVIGASVKTRGFDPQFPFPVEIETGEIGGASAGLMFSLGVFDAVTPGVLPRGRAIAGTGTIAQDGKVGPIGGAMQKVIAAERDGAEIFLAPRENFEEASRAARSIKVIAVDTFDQAVGELCKLEPRDRSDPEQTAPCPLS